jgi:hypothetical protein
MPTYSLATRAKNFIRECCRPAKTIPKAEPPTNPRKVINTVILIPPRRYFINK